MDKKDDPEFITPELCEAYREAIRAEVKSIKNAIYIGLSMSTAIITIIMYILQVVR